MQAGDSVKTLTVSSATTTHLESKIDPTWALAALFNGYVHRNHHAHDRSYSPRDRDRDHRCHNSDTFSPHPASYRVSRN